MTQSQVCDTNSFHPSLRSSTKAALREERFHVLPHPDVAEYVRRKGADVDRWIGGMQRWQGSLFPKDAHPANWLLKSD